jgi:hypothetical protein
MRERSGLTLTAPKHARRLDRQERWFVDEDLIVNQFFEYLVSLHNLDPNLYLADQYSP